MLTNAQQKYVQSLQQKKYRKLNNAFIVEGRKNVTELFGFDFTIEAIFSTPGFLPEIPPDFQPITTGVTAKELEKMSLLATPDSVLAVVKQQPNAAPDLSDSPLTLVLDAVNDPGNLGTILRIADWYGIAHIICSESTVEVYNPKVIMASMGSFGRVRCYYTDLADFFSRQTAPAYGAYLSGESVYDVSAAGHCFLVMGSESHGINPELSAFISKKITIPRIGKAESLNVAVSTAVLVDNLLQNKLK